ncbi:pyridoxal phosphate-dependent aminotransferase [Clostridium chrysemydis]|uniref:pyridoxal phosphate-dependent aminotransferase n=1 Tax=Clostridium chrysemydis TaxID=2665504 RepID=UPI001883187D|nr:aminotransferase class I/II-fold pyridoxal phosphate-dependent enzyme [Clostridium chrysemydis]
MNNNLKNIEVSGIRKFYNKVLKIDGAISLTLGQPDFKTPKAITDGIKKAIDDGKTVYTENAGIKELREEISNYLKSLDISYSKDEICITVGGSEGIYIVLNTLLNPKDKILIPSPGYPAYESIAKILGAEVLEYGFKYDFSLDIEGIRKSIKEEGVKNLILSFPSNPTGAILSKEDRDKLIELIKEEDLTVVTDEIYASIIYDDYYSVAQDESLKNNIIYISGFSKMFSATGLRIGYVCASDAFMKEMMKVHQYFVSCAPSIVQYGMVEGLKKSKEDLNNMVTEFKRRRDYSFKRLKDMGLTVAEPKGAFYIFPSIKKYNLSSEEFCEKLLFEEKVALVPGDAFGSKGEGYFRISYCYSDEELKSAFDILEKFIEKLNK